MKISSRITLVKTKHKLPISHKVISRQMAVCITLTNFPLEGTKLSNEKNLIIYCIFDGSLWLCLY